MEKLVSFCFCTVKMRHTVFFKKTCQLMNMRLKRSVLETKAEIGPFRFFKYIFFSKFQTNHRHILIFSLFHFYTWFVFEILHCTIQNLYYVGSVVNKQYWKEKTANVKCVFKEHEMSHKINSGNGFISFVQCIVEKRGNICCLKDRPLHDQSMSLLWRCSFSFLPLIRLCVSLDEGLLCGCGRLFG